MKYLRFILILVNNDDVITRKRIGTSYLRDAYLLDVYVTAIRNYLIIAYIGNFFFPLISSFFHFLLYY